MTPKQLREWRLRQGFSQAELADALGLTRVTVTRWENGRTEMPPFLRLALMGLVVEHIVTQELAG